MNVEQLLTASVISRDQSLAFSRSKKIDEFLSEIDFDMRMLFGVNHDDTVGVKHPLITFDNYTQRSLLFESQIGGAVTQSVALSFTSHDDDFAHTSAGF